MDQLFLVTISKNSRLHNTTLQISEEVALELGVSEDEPISIFVGRLGYHQKIRITNKTGRIAEINPAVLRRLHFSGSRKYGILKYDNIIHFGPVVGIMAETGHDIYRPFNGQSNFLRELIMASRPLGEICYGFSPDSINFHSMTISGYTFINGVWKRGIFPMPDVVYPREGGYSSRHLQVRNKLKALGCKFINPPLIGKWQTHKILSQNLLMHQYIPDTRRLHNFSQIESMLERYGAVYLKPINGSQGKNIIKVARINNANLYKYYYQVKYQPREGTANGFKSLQQSLRKLMGSHSYIVQRRLNLLRVGGNIADVRVLVQKDDTGQYTVTGKACRIGKKGSITSNISGGGSGQKLSGILDRYFPDQVTRDRIAGEINYLALEAAKELDANVAAIGELGIDIGIESSGKIWFIEANLKPARQVFVLTGQKATRRMSIVKPLLYARYLADYSREG